MREAELVGVVDHDRVDVGDVDPVFDDRRRDQHVDLTIDEPRHDRLQFGLVHLTVADRYASLGHELLECSRHAVDRFDAVVKVVDLPSAIELRDDRLLDDGG